MRPGQRPLNFSDTKVVKGRKAPEDFKGEGVLVYVMKREQAKEKAKE